MLRQNQRRARGARTLELLVTTLAYTTQGHDTNAIANLHQVASTLKNAPGLMNTRIYRSRGPGAYFLILTGWEHEDYWQKARGQHNPRQLLAGAMQDLLVAPPEQWLMQYLWGYSRPGARPQHTALHLLTTHPGQGEGAQRHWLDTLQQQAIEPTLAFAFLARGTKEGLLPETEGKNADTGLRTAMQQGGTLLNLLSWQTEGQRAGYYSSAQYQKTERFLNAIGSMQVLALEQF